jgi:hypothetical protein
MWAIRNMVNSSGHRRVKILGLWLEVKITKTLSVEKGLEGYGWDNDAPFKLLYGALRVFL